MAKRKPLTPEQHQALLERLAKARAAKQKQTPPKVELKEPEQTLVAEPASPQPLQATPAISGASFTPEQFEQLLAALSRGRSDTAAPIAFGGQQTNLQGQVVGSIAKFNIDPLYYPNPVADITAWFDSNKRTRRLAFSDNYFLTWEMDSNPYDTKYGTSVREPFFHATLYGNLYDDEGETTDKFHIIQTLHFNEDESTALDIAASLGINATHENMRTVMDDARFERLKRWLLGIFFPEHNFDLSTSWSEEAIGGQVVKVITKSNVKGFGNSTPSISVDELK